MDKKEFYKEIMSQYTFDESKIRRNAKRSSSVSFLDRHGKWLPLSSAAAVFITVFGGYMVFSPMLTMRDPITEPDVFSPGSIITEQSTATPYNSVIDGVIQYTSEVSNDKRLDEKDRLMERFNSNKLGSEMKDMYITFTFPITYAEFILTIDTMISDTGIIRIESVWDGAFIDNTTAKSKYSSDTDKTFTAAKIQAPANLYGLLLDAFEFVDCGDIVNDNNFIPLTTEKNNPDNNDNNNINTDVPVVTSNKITETTAIIVTTTPAETQTPQETQIPQTTTINDVTTIIPEETTPSESETLNPVNSTTTLEIPVENVINIEFISNNCFLILTKDKVSLNEIVTSDGKAYSKEISSYEVYDSKITYICKETGTFVIIGMDSFKRRTNLYIANGTNGTLTQIDTSAIAQDASISYAYCNGNRILMKAQSLDYSYFYIAEKDAAGEFRLNELSDISRSSKQAVILSYDDVSFVYMLKETNENGVEIIEIYEYSYNGFTSYKMDLGIEFTSDEILSENNADSFSFVRSSDLTSFAINNNKTNESWIWNAKHGEISEKLNTNITKFSDYNSNIFTDGTNWYSLDKLEIEVISESEAALFSVKPMFSNKYTVTEVTPDMVKIKVN